MKTPCERCHMRPATTDFDNQFVCEDCREVLLRVLETELDS